MSSQAPALSARQWRADLAFLLAQIEQVHPYPFGKTPRARFRAAARALRGELPGLGHAQVVVRLMQLVASLGDGHTTLKPLDPVGFNRWYPLRFYDFADGLFLTAAGMEHRELVGAEVLRIGEWAAAEAAHAAASLQGADNDLAQRERNHYLSNAQALFGLGITPTADSLRLELRPRDGAPRVVELAPRETHFENDNWMFWGEMYGPPGLEMVALPGFLPAAAFRENRPEVPLHARCRIPFFAEWLEDGHSLYLQFNFVQDWQNQTFRDFYLDLFARLDQRQPERFILDLRYNSGGNGGLLIPFLHEFIRRDAFFRPGKLVVLTGRKTFSAGVMVIGYLKQHVHALFAGEPAGAPLNHFGDALHLLLPNSAMELQVSSLYHQMAKSDERSPYTPLHFPAVFTSRQYFAGEDPGLELALDKDLRSIPQLFWEQGSAAASAAFAGQTQRFGGFKGWLPFSEAEMNGMGYRLLQAGRTADAIAAFRANTQRYPSSGNTWDSLAEAHASAGEEELARAAYRRALELNPGNAAAREFLRLGT